MDIREARESDYHELRQIYLESRRTSFYWANKDEMSLDDFDQDTIDESIVLAEEKGRILGFISLYLPENFIHLLFVHPEHTGRRVGTRLVDYAAEKLNKPIRLKCVSANQKAMLFYEKNGWTKVKEEGERGEEYWILTLL
ncbi:GNAT family N-acetyltransferase [Paenibacillus sp. NPDC058071]|uniref:GNAT family N-acetyltransferase n=1 Tax=Paenibacillus sp. NPDC058071 TaxID=3346326 RepID=UPI0036DDC33F